ncbi:MAG: DUF3105 domain-containing protein [Chloroflexota bacterium]
MSKKQSNAKERRQSKREQRRQQLEREQRMRKLYIWIPVVVVVALIGLFIYRLNEPHVDGVVFAAEEVPANQHDSSLVLEFEEVPPMGGPHNPTWQNCGIYEIPVEGQYAIHSMEHGAVWITYQPDLPANEVEMLQDFARDDGRVLLSPYPGQRSKLFLTTWDIQLELDSVTDDRIEEFVTRYRNKRGPEIGASCSGGRGAPIS